MRPVPSPCGVFVLAPWLRTSIEPFLGKKLGFQPLFQGPPYGVGMLAAGVILAIMITPTISSISREVFSAVPRGQREAVLALGSTRWEMMRIAVLDASRPGVIGAIILGLGLFRQQQIARLSRAGARWAAVHGSTYQSEQGKSAPTGSDVLSNVVTPKMVGLDSKALTCNLTMTSTTATVTITYKWTPEGYFSAVTLSSTSVQPITY